MRKRSETNPEACRTFDMAFRRDPAGGPLRFAGSTNPQPYPCSLAPT